MIRIRVTNLGLLSRYKWRLDETYVYRFPFYGCDGSDIDGYVSVNKKGLLRIEKGYCWDGASGPTWDTVSVRRASLVHDAWYQLIREGVAPLSSKDVADSVLYRIMIEDGAWEWRAKIWRWAVDRFGGPFTRREMASREQDHNQ